jgi:hypothetical protein
MAFEAHPGLPASLYKYAGETGTFAILENGTLQISRPALFNDLLDMSATLRIDMNDDPAVVTEQILDQQYEGLYGNGPLQHRNTFGRAMALMRLIFPTCRDPQKWRDDMRPGVEAQVRDHPAMAQKLSAALTEYLATSKVLCLSASGTSAPMWGNYANTLQGAAFKFSPKNEESFFRGARPVSYDGPPLMLNQHEYIDWMSGRLALEDIDLFTRYVFTKDPSWAYEQEWRLFYGDGQKRDQDKEYEPFDPTDLEAVIVGSRMKAADLERVKALMAERYKQTKIMRIAKSAAGAYVVEDL